MNGRRHDRGFVLLIVLWTLAILALLASTLIAGARTETRLAFNARGAASARSADDAAIAATVVDLLRDGSPPVRRRIGPVTVSVRLEDLSGRINPNRAPAALLKAFLEVLGANPGQAESVAAAIVDWRSPGTVPGPHGAKADAYRAAGMAYGPPGRPFQHLDEIGAVLGVTPAMLTAMLPHLTLWSNGDPDPGFADGVVLSALRAAGVAMVPFQTTGTRIVAITAVASTPGASGLTRRAVIRFGFSPDGRSWRVLAWDDGTSSR